MATPDIQLNDTTPILDIGSISESVILEYLGLNNIPGLNISNESENANDRDYSRFVAEYIVRFTTSSPYYNTLWFITCYDFGAILRLSDSIINELNEMHRSELLSYFELDTEAQDIDTFGDLKKAFACKYMELVRQYKVESPQMLLLKHMQSLEAK